MMKYFSADMTSDELRTRLFSLVDGKTKEEIKKEYKRVSPIVTQRELEFSIANGIMTSVKLP